MFEYRSATLRRIALVLGTSLVLAGCAVGTGATPGETPFTTSEATASTAPTAAVTTETAVTTAAPDAVMSFVGLHLRSSRVPVLDALDELGYECGAERLNPPDVPTIVCTFPGGTANEAVVVFAAADDFRGLGLFTYDRDRMAEFLSVMGSEDISANLMGDLERTAEIAAQPDSICPFPCETVQSGPELGNVEAHMSVYGDLLLFAALQEVNF